MVGISSLGRTRENFFQGPLRWEKLSLSGVWDDGLFLTKYRLVLCLDNQFLLARWCSSNFYGRESLEGLSFRLEGDSYSFKSSIVRLTIEIKVYSE